MKIELTLRPRIEGLSDIVYENIQLIDDRLHTARMVPVRQPQYILR